MITIEELMLAVTPAVVASTGFVSTDSPAEIYGIKFKRLSATEAYEKTIAIRTIGIAKAIMDEYNEQFHTPNTNQF